jgi:hypothetical protein
LTVVIQTEPKKILQIAKKLSVYALENDFYHFTNTLVEILDRIGRINWYSKQQIDALLEYLETEDLDKIADKFDDWED